MSCQQACVHRRPPPWRAPLVRRSHHRAGRSLRPCSEAGVETCFYSCVETQQDALTPILLVAQVGIYHSKPEQDTPTSGSTTARFQNANKGPVNCNGISGTSCTTSRCGEPTLKAIGKIEEDGGVRNVSREHK